MIQVTQEQVQKLGNENKSLQDKIISITNQLIEMEHFKTKASEIYANIEEEQQKIFRNMEIIQNYFQESKRSMEKVVQKEREAKGRRIRYRSSRNHGCYSISQHVFCRKSNQYARAKGSGNNAAAGQIKEK